MRLKYRNKKFLSSAPGDTSCILLEVEDSEDGKKKSGQNTIVIEDSKNRVELDFYLGTARSRKEALSRICFLVSAFIRFGHALMLESQAIENVESPKPTKKLPKKPTKKRRKNAR